MMVEGLLARGTHQSLVIVGSSGRGVASDSAHVVLDESVVLVTVRVYLLPHLCDFYL